MIKKSPQARIDAARSWAITNPATVFYGALACQLQDIIDPTTETAATNGRVIKWNPAFVDRLSDAEVRFVLLHEVLHCAHGHFWRLPLTTEGNIAGDYVINRTLRGVSGIVAPKGALDDRKFDKLAEEEVLAALDQQPQQSPTPQPQDGQGGRPAPQQVQGDGQGEADDTPEAGKPAKSKGNSPAQPADKGGCGGFEAPAPDKPAEAGKAEPLTLKEEWERATVQAAQIAQSLAQGNLPADAKRLLDRVRVAARPDWRAETADFIRSAAQTRVDYSRQARRTATASVLYPRRRPDDVGTVVFVRDTSGSVDNRIVAQFNAHIENLMADTGCEAIVIDCDAKVHAEHRLASCDTVPARALGGGGTDFRPAFDRVAELVDAGDRIAGIVYLTDLLGTFPQAEADVPTLWVATSDCAVPFGRTVRIEVEA